ncbi:hypothetical protein EKI60_06420 [Candidatus Saccharibacteria bacterium]|nr:MAG: hypothetical protein EKI60_06420 [Candidatus Saccharibacteria bacterium]
MAKIDTIQTSFVGGELAPALFGRTDVAQYANACAIVENFLIRPFGSLISTPGTEFINECKTGGSTSISRLIPFIFSRTDSYVIEMGVGYFRFYNNGAIVVSPGTTPYEIAHTYTASEIPEVQYCQLNDVIFLTHANHKPAKLTRLGATSWTLADFDFIGGPFMPDNTSATTLQVSSVTSGATINVTVSPTNASIFIPSSGSTAGHVGAYFKIGSTTTNATTGLAVQGYVKITNVVNSYTATATVMSLISTAGATTMWAEGSWSAYRGYPARCTFHQQRLAFARTASEPQNVWASKSFIFDNFAVDGGQDDDAINVQLASSESNDIKWLSPGRDLIAGTYGGEFKIGTGDGSPLTPSNVNVAKQTSWGSEAVIPKKIGNFVYYIQRFGRKLRELFYTWDLDNYKSVDKTILSPHISGDGFIDMTYQQNPDTILWCVCSNGTIATMTREVDQEVQGWARQITDGYYEAIASIPSASSPHDEVWVVVRRNINGTDKRYIERFVSQEVPDRQDKCFFVHSGLSYDAFEQTSALTATTISLNKTSGTSCVVTSSAAYFSSDDVGQRIRAIDSEGTILGEMEIVGYTSSTIVIGDIKYAFNALTYAPNYWGVSVSSISGLNHLEGETVSVLGDGGTDKPNKVVSNGSITLAYNYFVVTAGVPYTQKIKTLPQEAGSQRGTSQGKIQRINQVGFKVNRSHKGFSVGGAADSLDSRTYSESTSASTIFIGTIPNPNFVLTKVAFRDPTTLLGTPELLYTGTIPNIYFRDDYRYGAQVLLENYDPLPIELLNIITSIDTNDK